jgi:hypothetical protein
MLNFTRMTRPLRHKHDHDGHARAGGVKHQVKPAWVNDQSESDSVAPLVSFA